MDGVRVERKKEREGEEWKNNSEINLCMRQKERDRGREMEELVRDEFRY